MNAPAVPVCFTVETAAAQLSSDLCTRITRRALFEHLISAGWTQRTSIGYRPSAFADLYELLTTIPARLANGTVWDQIVLTPAGLQRLRDDLAQQPGLIP